MAKTHKKIVHKTLELTKDKTKKNVDGFVDFIRSQGVVGIAIGFILGTQARILVDQFSASFVNPVLGLIVGSSDGLSSKNVYFTVNGETATFAWGAFLYSLINFVIVAAIVYFTFRWLRLDRLDKKKT